MRLSASKARSCPRLRRQICRPGAAREYGRLMTASATALTAALWTIHPRPLTSRPDQSIVGATCNRCAAMQGRPVRAELITLGRGITPVTSAVIRFEEVPVRFAAEVFHRAIAV